MVWYKTTLRVGKITMPRSTVPEKEIKSNLEETCQCNTDIFAETRHSWYLQKKIIFYTIFGYTIYVWPDRFLSFSSYAHYPRCWVCRSSVSPSLVFLSTSSFHLAWWSRQRTAQVNSSRCTDAHMIECIFYVHRFKEPPFAAMNAAIHCILKHCVLQSDFFNYICIYI